MIMSAFRARRMFRGKNALRLRRGKWMISWRDRRRIAEEVQLQQSVQHTTAVSWWRTAINVINSPIVLAVVVSTVLGFLTQTFQRSERCFEQLQNANQYWQ